MHNKTINRLLNIKEVSEAGEFEGYGSVFDNEDSYSDVVVAGAFQKSLETYQEKGRMPAMLWQHNPGDVIGVWQEMREDEKGLYVRGRLALGTAKGKEAYELLKMDAITGLSIGFHYVEAEYDADEKIFEVREVDLWEVSLVTFPANDEARIQAVKAALMADSLPTIREFESTMIDLGFSRNQAKAIVSEGFKSLMRDASGNHDSDQRDAEKACLEGLKALQSEMKNFIERIRNA